MAPRSRRNPPYFAGYSDLDMLGGSKQGTPAPSGAGPLDIPVPIPAPAKYTEEDLRTMTSSAWIRSSRLKPVIPNPEGNEKWKIISIHTAGAMGSNCPPFAALFLRGQRSGSLALS